MKNTFNLIAVVVLFASNAAAQSMMRVVAASPETLTVEIGSRHETLRLAGTQRITSMNSEWVERIERRIARELIGKFVMLEHDGSAYAAYRSPDGLFVNQWLVAEGLATVAEGACANCDVLRRAAVKAEVTGQGWWSTGNRISSRTLTTFDYLGQVAPAGAGRASGSASPPPPKRSSSRTKARGKKR